MSKEMFPDTIDNDQGGLKLQVEILQRELDSILKETRSFELVLRSQLSDLIVESQELFVLYKEIKKAKKVKRLEQKKRGKNYKEPKGLQAVSSKKVNDIPLEDQKEKKRLYREAMLHVHPDKFHMSAEDADVATEITKRLIDIYTTESLDKLRAYHAYIFNGHSEMALIDSASDVKVDAVVDYWQMEVERIEQEIKTAKNEHLYKVITEYDDPLIFVEELKAYYDDRIFKLRKRTRKGL